MKSFENIILCPVCMKEHNEVIRDITIDNIFKGEKINYDVEYCYCSECDEYYETEKQMDRNDISMKNVYRKKMGLLTSDEIADIRKKYDISQSDLALVLGWGEKTITRYEGHQVQDAAHDSILRKIDDDPQWYLQLLADYHNKHSLSFYAKYHNTATELFEKQKDTYLRKAIMAVYAVYQQPDRYNGYALLNLNKVIDIIRYFSNLDRVKMLSKEKLMTMIWYSDILHFKKYEKAITGLVYKSLPTGVCAIGDNLLVCLNGINYEEIDGKRFAGDRKEDYPSLNEKQIEIINQVIDTFGECELEKIIDYIHNDEIYSCAETFDIIQFRLTDKLIV